MSDLVLDTAALPGAATVQAMRRRAAELFARAGLPERSDEDWKYTDMSRLTAALGDQWWLPSTQTVEGLPDHAIDGLDAYRLVFAAGQFQPQHSTLPAGVRLQPLSALLDEQDNDKLSSLFALDEGAPLFSGLLAANAALAADGLCACIDDGVVLDKPLHMVHVGGGTAHLRSGIMLGRGAQATLIEHFAATGDASLSNVATCIRLGDQAQLTHYRLQMDGTQQFHTGRVDVCQQRDSRYRLHAVELGAALSRADIVVDLAESGAACELNGLFVASGRQHIDHHTRIDHNAPHCKSRENYRTVLDGRAHGVFNGKIVVAEGAFKTDSAQHNANLLLSRHAEIDTKPELEIYNDDVKCAHGVTVGQLDQNQLFYLKSRGLSEDAARQMLIFAFADELLVGMDLPAVRRFVERKAFAKLPNMAELEGLLG